MEADGVVVNDGMSVRLLVMRMVVVELGSADELRDDVVESL